MKILTHKAPLFFLFIIFSSAAFSQNRQYTRLVIQEKETFEVGPENVLIVDTLIMHDRATIKFNPALKGVLKVGMAYIGSKCTIASKGENGKDTQLKEPGTEGQDGGNLDITIHFEKLKSLLIDTQGGMGGKGLNGKDGKNGRPEKREKQTTKGRNGEDIITFVYTPGVRGTDGTNATQGLKGGNGGDIAFNYSTNNFIPVFNHANADHSITLLHTIGTTGKDGRPGKGGFGSTDGEVIYEKKAAPADGQIRLTNLNKKTGPY